MNHKRKGPKSTRAGCLLCKPHKLQGNHAQNREGHHQAMLEHQRRQQLPDEIHEAIEETSMDYIPLESR